MFATKQYFKYLNIYLLSKFDLYRILLVLLYYLANTLPPILIVIFMVI